MPKKTTVGRALAAVAIAASSTAWVGASSSYAAIDCTQYGTNKDGGYLYTNGPYHTGPAGECATLPAQSGKAYIWCSKFNAYGNLWYYVRDATSNTVGWVWSGNVSSVVDSNHAKC
ncbi:hypothetical protein ACWEOO_03585 [Kribbella sp. NPDC004138]